MVYILADFPSDMIKGEKFMASSWFMAADGLYSSQEISMTYLVKAAVT